jgi:integrase
MVGSKALEFAILTAARSGEVRGLTWDEIDFHAKTWDNSGKSNESQTRTHYDPVE